MEEPKGKKARKDGAESLRGIESARTPRKLAVGPAQYTTSSLQIPSLDPPISQVIPDTMRSSQSPPRSPRRTPRRTPGRTPGRSPTRRLELIQLSPMRKSRLELKKLYDTQQAKYRKETLYIDTLVLKDFKSYSGTQKVGPFHTSFSAVVGPNGSGKSNVIDAMLFVFGFRASKMRQERISDLIHKSEEYPCLQSCSVEVHFKYVLDDPDLGTREPINKPGLVVARKAFKNNSSKYFINERESTYTEVTTLLKNEGIDLDHKRFLILQGEVENIAQMKSKAEKDGDDGLLEYLEDIIGTTKYKLLIQEKSIQMEDLNEVCLEKENRYSIAEREKQSLEGGKDAALEFLDKERQMTIARSKLIQFNIFQTNKKLTSTLTEKSTLQEQLNEEELKFKLLKENVAKLETDLKNHHHSRNGLKNKEKQLSESKRRLENDSIGLEAKIKNISQKIDKENSLFEQTTTSIEENMVKIDSLNSSTSQLNGEIEVNNNQIEKERKVLEQIKLTMRDKTHHLSLEIQQHEKEIEPWNLELREVQSQIEITESEIAFLLESKERLKIELLQLKEDVDAIEKSKSEKGDLINILQKKKIRLTQEIKDGETDFMQAKEKMKSMQQSLDAMRQRTMDIRSSVSTTKNKNTVLSALSKLQKSGRITGFHGRLGDLGFIDDKYDIAVSTACPRLDDIVVETVECGQACIDYLRKNRLGYARFILMDKLRKFDISKIDTPEGAPRIFDLVTPEKPEFAPVFYSVLRDTLVATDLKQANRVSYGPKRFRVVTLDGKLVDISGTLTGGGSSVTHGLMNLRSNSNILKQEMTEDEALKLENELLDKEENFKEAALALHQMETELRNLRDREPETEIELSKTIMEIETLDQAIASKLKLQTEKEKMLNESMEDKKALSDLQAKLEGLREKSYKIKNKTKFKEQKIEDLKNDIMRLGGNELQEQNAKVLGIEKAIEKAIQRQKKNTSYLKKAERELMKLHKSLEEISKNRQSWNTEVETLKFQLEETGQNIFDLEKSLNEAIAEKQKYDLKCQEIKKNLADIEIDMGAFKSFEIEINSKLEKLENVVKGSQKELKHYEQELSKLSIRDITNTLEKLDRELRDLENGLEHKPSPSEESMASDSKNNGKGSESRHDIDLQSMDLDSTEISGGIPLINDKDLEMLDIEDLRNHIKNLEEYLDSAHADIDVLEDYLRQLSEYKKRKLDLNDAVRNRSEIESQLNELKQKRFNEFMNGFGIISMTLKEMYQMITMGGNAELELVDSLDPFSEGVTFSVMPPKKSWRNITNLSGGEKTLSSLALVFALHKYKPTPLYVMDEIDAALDFRNVSIVANYIKEQTKNAQFIVISLRNNMFELAQQLIGIYKRENKTKSATVQNKNLLC